MDASEQPPPPGDADAQPAPDPQYSAYVPRDPAAIPSQLRLPPLNAPAPGPKRLAAPLSRDLNEQRLILLCAALENGCGDATACHHAGLWPDVLRTLRVNAATGDPVAEYYWAAIVAARTHYEMRVTHAANKAADGWEAVTRRKKKRTYTKGGEEVTEEEEATETGTRFSPEAAMKRAALRDPATWADQLERRIALMNEEQMDAILGGTGSLPEVPALPDARPEEGADLENSEWRPDPA